MEPVGRVVVVEDEAAVREAVLAGLRHEGFVASGFADAVDPEMILAAAPDLAVLDVPLPSEQRVRARARAARPQRSSRSSS